MTVGLLGSVERLMVVGAPSAFMLLVAVGVQ